MSIGNKEINFHYKGGREYVHGTDMVNSVLACFQVKDIINIKISIHDFISSPLCELVVYNKQPTELTGKLQGRLTIKGEKKWFELIEKNAQQYNSVHIDYNENKVTELCLLEDKSVILTGEGPFTFIENIVSMKKFLLNSQYPKDEGKWIFTQLEMDEYYDFRENLKIEITHNLKDKLIRSNILHNEVIIGKLYFSLVMM